MPKIRRKSKSSKPEAGDKPVKSEKPTKLPVEPETTQAPSIKKEPTTQEQNTPVTDDGLKQQQTAQLGYPEFGHPYPPHGRPAVVASNPFEDQSHLPHPQDNLVQQQRQPLHSKRAGRVAPPARFLGPMHTKLPPPSTQANAAPQKVYPPNQPMVFNASNPNAPPIYPCGICHKEVHDNDQAILCESGCNFWFHRRCTGLTESAYQMLTQEVYAEWVCDRCLQTKEIPLIKMKP